MQTPIVALLYDFDHTLSTRDMQEYRFIPSLGMTPEEFWAKSARITQENGMDSILTCLYLMLSEPRARGIQVTRDYWRSFGPSIQYYPGVKTWFSRINRYGASLGIKVEHYIISAGLTEIIEGTDIANEFCQIYACKYRYDEQGLADWPALAVNSTGKTQFLFRINKGITDISDSETVNRPMDEKLRRVPFRNMIYLGDGLTDVPAMRLTRINGGRAIAVYQDARLAGELLQNDRVDFACPADYEEGTPLEAFIKQRIKEISQTQK